MFMVTQYEELTDSQWEVIKEYLPVQRKRKYDLRIIVNAILHILRTGEQWRNLRGAQVPWNLVYYYFSKWRRDGTLICLNSALNQKERLRQGKKPTPSMVCIDSQSIKAAPFIHQDKGVDGNKKINGRKRHLLVDTLGLTWAVMVHSADVHDGTTAHILVEHLLGYLPRLQKILADKAYEKVFYRWVENNIAGLEVELSSKPPDKKGFVPVRWRWVNERSFGWLNFFRRHAKDYERTVQSAEAWILWANCQIILNRLNKSNF